MCVIPPIAHPSSPLDTPLASHSASHSPASSVSPQMPPDTPVSFTISLTTSLPGPLITYPSLPPDTTKASHPLTWPLTHPHRQYCLKCLPLCTGLDSSRSLRQNRASPVIPHSHASISTSARLETAHVSFQAHRLHIPPRLPVPISLAFFHPLTHPLTHPPCPHPRSLPSPLLLSPLLRSPPHSSPPFH